MNKELSRKQRGTYAEYRVISELIKLGLDVYTPCVDEIGIDCIIRADNKTYYDIQIKKCKQSVSIRGALPIFKYLNNNPKNYYLIVIITHKNKPDDIIYLNPSQIREHKKSFKKEDDIIIPAKKRDELIKSQPLEILRDIL